MDTRKVVEEMRLSYWAQIMNERQESGLSIRAFCENAGVHENISYYWQRKLREAACEEINRKQQDAQTNLVSSKFAEVNPREETTFEPPIESHQSQISIEISRVQIKTDSGYPIGKSKMTFMWGLG